MTDDQKNELISDAGEITFNLLAIVNAGKMDMMQAMFSFIQVAVKAQEWEKKRARFGELPRKEPKP